MTCDSGGEKKESPTTSTRTIGSARSFLSRVLLSSSPSSLLLFCPDDDYSYFLFILFDYFCMFILPADQLGLPVSLCLSV